MAGWAGFILVRTVALTDRFWTANKCRLRPLIGALGVGEERPRLLSYRREGSET